MWECKYAKEPLDFKLLWLRFRKRIWIVPVAMLMGALLVMGCHYFAKVVSNGGRNYQATSIYYLDFASDDNGNPYEYFNYFTWGDLIHSDYFMDNLYERLGGKYSKEELIGYVSATIESDVRYLYVRVTTHSKENSVEIAGAFEPIVTGFADVQKEFNSISVSDKGDTFKDSTKLRMKNAGMLGAVLGLFVSGLMVLLVAVLDTKIYIPSTLERRFKIAALGSPCMSEYAINCEHYLKDAGKIAYVSVDGDDEAPDFHVTGETIVVTGALKDSSACEIIRSCDALIIGVKAAAGNDKMTERYLDEFARLDINVTAFVLTDADDRLIKAYY